MFAVVSFAGANTEAQTTETVEQTAAKAAEPNKQTAEEKAEQQEVQKFVESFLQSLDETKDLDKVPAKFFVTDFKTRFAQNEEFSGGDKFFTQLIESERYEFNVSLFNLIHLQMMYFVGNSEFKADEDADEGEIKDIYAPEALKILKRSAGLRDLLDVDSNEVGLNADLDVEINNFVEFRDAFNDLKLITEVQSKYFNERSQKWKEEYTRNLSLAKKKSFGDREAFYRAKFCEEDDGYCEGLLEKTRLFSIEASLPLGLKIIKEQGELKILNVILIGD